MRLGLLTDIHESVEYLKMALTRFESEGVDQIVVIGDIFEMGHRIEETCRLLVNSRCIGVWGNHDYGLCVEPDADLCARYGDHVIQLMTSLKPRLVIEGCYFSHIEPWLNPEDLADLWYFEGPPPDKHGNLNRIFDAVPEPEVLSKVVFLKV